METKIKFFLVASVMLICGSVYCKDAAIFKAIEEGNTELALRLAKNGQMEIVNSKGNTPLYEACLTGNLTLVKALVEHGANIMHHDKTGFTVLGVLGSICVRLKQNTEKQVKQLVAQGFSEETARQLAASSSVPPKYKGKEKQFTEILEYLNEIKCKRPSEDFTRKGDDG